MVNMFMTSYYIFMLLAYLLAIIVVFCRREIIDAIKLRIMTFLGHDFCIVRIYKNDKRIKKYVIKPAKDSKEFEIEGGIYMLIPERAYFEGSIPTYSYIEGSYMPIDPNDIKTSVEVDPSLVNKVVMRAKATGKLAEWLKQNRMMMVFLIVIGVMVLACAYFSYKNFQFIQPVVDQTIEQLFIKYCSGTAIVG